MRIVAYTNYNAWVAKSVVWGRTTVHFALALKNTHRITELETIDPISQNISQIIVMLGILSKIVWRSFVFLIRDEY
jgi:hypothetical protein